jgi:hypothetical protein
MDRPQTLSVALKEWNVLCDALGRGEQFILLRKGGIHEEHGEFRLEHARFLLFPTFLHQDPRMLKPAFASRVQASQVEPAMVRLAAWAEVSDILQVRSRQQIDAIDAEHVWSPPLIDMRFSYKPTKPLYLLLVRAWTLPRAVELSNVPLYAGCVSWVPLEAEVPIAGSSPAIPDEQWATRRASLLARLA